MSSGPTFLDRVRDEARSWVESHLATWPQVHLFSLNFRPSVLGDAGFVLFIDESTARREVERFCKRVDRRVYGRLVQRFNRRVRRIPFLEYGRDRGWHAHVLMECPKAIPEVCFTQLVRGAWSESPWSVGIHQRIADEGASGYLTKGRSKAELEAWIDTIVIEAVFVDTK